MAKQTLISLIYPSIDTDYAKEFSLLSSICKEIEEKGQTRVRLLKKTYALIGIADYVGGRKAAFDTVEAYPTDSEALYLFAVSSLFLAYAKAGAIEYQGETPSMTCFDFLIESRDSFKLYLESSQDEDVVTIHRLLDALLKSGETDKDYCDALLKETKHLRG